VSINFDRAADYYDATRGYPPEIAEAIGKAIGAAVGATPATRFLEIGVGTGRIALPIIAQGYELTGVDISQRMLDRLREKLEDLARASATPLRATLQVADMMALPFEDAQFDVVVAAHVFHLVEDAWRAGQEALRVLRPGGMFLICGDRVTGTDPAGVNETWRAIVAEEFGPIPSSAEAADRLIRELQAARAVDWVDELRPVSWEFTTSVAEEMDGIRQRLWSNTWLLPEDVYARCLSRLVAWAEAAFAGRMDAPLERTAEFVIRRMHRTRDRSHPGQGVLHRGRGDR
jgi:ubiquinone/menaquinone biosynthesis C-methylase UbiE